MAFQFVICYNASGVVVMNDAKAEQFLKSGALSEPFLDVKIIEQKVMSDYNAKVKSGQAASKVASLISFIKHNLKSAGSGDDIANKKFSRTAKEVWESCKATGCTDYCLVFAVFARQLGVPCIMADTVSEKWAQNHNNGIKQDVLNGHTFCECMHNGKWFVVDVINEKWFEKTSEDVISLDYKVNGEDKFFVVERGIDFGKRQTSKEHYEKIEKYCKSLIKDM